MTSSFSPKLTNQNCSIQLIRILTNENCIIQFGLIRTVEIWKARLHKIRPTGNLGGNFVHKGQPPLRLCDMHFWFPSEAVFPWFANCSPDSSFSSVPPTAPLSRHTHTNTHLRELLVGIPKSAALQMGPDNLRFNSTPSDFSNAC